MAADIVNLRQARKRKARAEREAAAAENRLKFGRSRTERRHDAANKVLEDRRLDQLIRQRLDAKDDT